MSPSPGPLARWRVQPLAANRDNHESVVRTRHDDRHRLQDIRRDSSGMRVAWLITFRDEVASAINFLEIIRGDGAFANCRGTCQSALDRAR